MNNGFIKQLYDAHPVYVCKKCNRAFKTDQEPCSCTKHPSIMSLSLEIASLKEEIDHLREFMGEENYQAALKKWKPTGI